VDQGRVGGSGRLVGDGKYRYRLASHLQHRLVDLALHANLGGEPSTAVLHTLLRRFAGVVQAHLAGQRRRPWCRARDQGGDRRVGDEGVQVIQLGARRHGGHVVGSIWRVPDASLYLNASPRG
jgi:hypothetical protein